jgi:multiple sugar transport system substrate-binding protein
VRALWYWKDLLQNADVNPENLTTWNGYIESATKLNNVLKDRGIQGVHLVGAAHSPDMWYPYLWMLGGQILEQRSNHSENGSYWYPAFNSSQGVEALEFLKEQVDAGVAPQPSHFWGQEFADKKFAVMLEGSWLLGTFPRTEWNTLGERIGMLPLFPTPSSHGNTTTMMGGWVLSIPQASPNKDLAWELLTLMVSPDILTPMLQQEGYLPTQKPIGEGRYASQLNSTMPYYSELISMIPQAHSRPNIPEYPQIAENIKQAIDEVFYDIKEPKQALDDAAKRTADVLGWQ